MCLLTHSATAAHSHHPQPCPAKALNPAQRQTLAVQALASTAPITELATELNVSRKFVYQQQSIAQEALDDAFHTEPTDDDVLFHLPVTKRWIEQFVLGLVLIGHCPLRGVVEIFSDFFDHEISLGNVFNIVRRAVPAACAINDKQKLDSVRIGVHDEIFQNGKPVLVGADAASSYCYLMTVEEHRDTDTWGSHILVLTDHGFDPDAVVGDAGSGLRAGLAAALPEVPCRSDVFHALKEVHTVERLLENRAFRAMEACDKVRQKIAKLRQRGKPIPPALHTKISRARRKETRALELADDVALLADWLRQDVLALVGPPHSERLALYDFILNELNNRIPQAEDHLKKLTVYLSNQRKDLLAFSADLDAKLAALAEPLEIPIPAIRELFAVNALPQNSCQRWQRDDALRRILGRHYHSLSQAVDALRKATVRASSLVENINGRLRGYFFLRRQLGNEYLGLLQFFLNHRRFVRSFHKERVGKSPAELLTGQEHPHWVEMLGFKRFSRA
jgi:hypothetical protein